MMVAQYDGATTSNTKALKNMKTIGKIDTCDLILMRWVTNISSRSSKLEWDSWTHTNTYIARLKKVTEGTSYILDTLWTWYTQQAFTCAVSPYVFNAYEQTCFMIIRCSSMHTIKTISDNHIINNIDTDNHCYNNCNYDVKYDNDNGNNDNKS